LPKFWNEYTIAIDSSIASRLLASCDAFSTRKELQLAKKLEGKTPEKAIYVPVVPVASEAIDSPATKALYYEAACD
jgi:hypothetical protein